MMQQFADVASVQRWGACAFAEIADDVTQRAAARVLIRIGACEDIVAALVAHPLVANVQEAALDAAEKLLGAAVRR
ncbi:hypothetical protein JKP88DRAFT_283300 [Tribonema minus]|uniref:Uncharacterized protein n=1 Tax=Tribonema minus TaxID=303371 RepID=A0A835YLI6_9STRA|nr:hypothetical protein JKP88DRAFT_283300 [Tribonema minus]